MKIVLKDAKDASKFEGNKLYGVYYVVSNKTVRKNENFFKRKKSKFVPGIFVQTNRGYFIDGYQVDLKSAELWLALEKEGHKEI